MRSCKFSDPEHEVDLILSRAGILETPKDIDDFTNCPTQKISVLGGIVVPLADVGCHKKCPAMVKVGLSRFQKLIGELADVYHRYYSRCLENSYTLASVSRLLTTVSKITRDVRPKFRLGVGQ